MKPVSKFNMYYYPGVILFWMCLIAYNINVMLKADEHMQDAHGVYIKAKEFYRQSDSLLRETKAIRDTLMKLDVWQK